MIDTPCLVESGRTGEWPRPTVVRTGRLARRGGAGAGPAGWR